MLAGLLSSGVAVAEVRMPGIFGSHMVLQRGEPVRVWGRANAGEKVTVAFAGQSKAVTAGKDGKWMAVLGPLAASGEGRRLVVRGAKSKVVFGDVLVGEVWLFARQSTIDVSLADTPEGTKTAAAANVPAVRYFSISPAARPAPQEDFPPEGDLSGGRIFHSPIELPKRDTSAAKPPAGPWRVCSPATAGALSGAAFHFARDLQVALGVPVAVIDMAMGPSVMGSWLSRDVLEMAGTSDTSFGNAVPHAGPWNEKEAGEKHAEAMAKWEKNLANKRRHGESTNLIKPAVPVNPGYLLLLPGGCYNACVVPMRHMTMRGVLLYQGANYPYFPFRQLGKDFDPAEACNAYYSSYTYKKFLRYGITHKNFTALVPDWRKTFGDEKLAFGILQPCGSGNDRHTRDVLSSQLARFREVQAVTCRREPNAGLIVTFDLAQSGSRQPRDEAEVGRRSLRWALAEVYGRKDAVHTGPVYKSMTKKGNRIVLQFGAEGGKGIRAGGGGKLTGFTIGQKYEDHKGKTRSRFIPANARIVDGGKIEVSSDAMAEPAAARYAWATAPEGNLVNAAGLPASPFRTDDWAAEEDDFRALAGDFKKPMSEWDEPAMLLYGEKVASDTLGPTGLRGYSLGRNILVGSIEPGSPADGVVQVNDALIGANGRMFGIDPRVVLGTAIDESQTAEKKGILRLKLVRSGEVKEVEVPLEVTGAYSDTAPYDCPKSQKTLVDARAYIVEQMGADGNSGLCGAHSGLLLLSSGEARHLDPARRIVRKIIPGAMRLKPEGPSNPWNWHPAYEAIFLAEYYLATGDKQVIPALKRYALFFGYTQDDVLGAWGHSGAPGKHNYGYAGAAKGRVNSVGTACFLAWTLIGECRLRVDPAAFGRAEAYFRKHTIDGMLGYGAEPRKTRLKDMFPPEDFGKGLLPGCNGKAAAAGVSFHLLEPGGKITAEVAAEVADSYTRRERGHGGEFFSYVWGPIAASLGERAAFVNFMEKQRWYYALCRRWDHGFSCQYGGGDSVKYLRYGPEFPTGGYALAYAIPGGGLRILGGAPSVFSQELPEALAPARKLYDAKQYARSATALKQWLQTPDLPSPAKRLARGLLAAAERMDQSVRLTIEQITADIAAGDLYMANARLAALQPILAEGDTRCDAVKAALADPNSAAVLEAGKTFYAHHGKQLASGTRYVEGIAINARARGAMAGLAKNPAAGVYAKRAAKLLAENPAEEGADAEWTPLLPQNQHPWRLFCAEREDQLPDGWKRPDFDDSKWYKTTFPNSWWLDHWAIMRTRFELTDAKQYSKLRLAMRFEFCLDTDVYLNGQKIVRCERGVCAEPAIVLGEKEMAYLKPGENILTVKSLNWFRWNGITLHPFKVRLDGLK